MISMRQSGRHGQVKRVTAPGIGEEPRGLPNVSGRGMRTVARAAAVEPLDIDVRNSLALVALRSMRPAAAASLYLSVLRDDPLNPVARHNLRSTHEIVGWALTLLLIWMSLSIADAATDGAAVLERFPFALGAVAIGVAGW